MDANARKAAARARTLDALERAAGRTPRIPGIGRIAVAEHDQRSQIDFNVSGLGAYARDRKGNLYPTSRAVRMTGDTPKQQARDIKRAKADGMA